MIQRSHETDLPWKQRELLGEDLGVKWQEAAKLLVARTRAIAHAGIPPWSRRHADLPEPTEIVPEAVAFECNGEATGTICAKAVQNCIGQAEGHAQKLYEV